jgi:hypothetical protein
MTRPKFFVFLSFLVVIANCTTTTSKEQNPLPTPTATHILTLATQVDYSPESLAEAMMQVYPDENGIDYMIVGDRLLPEGSEITFDFVEVESESIAGFIGGDWDDIISPNGRFRAFVACDLENCKERLFVENLASSQILEVVFSMRMPWRSLNGLAWLDDSVLAFSQWSNPHYGFRFAVDANQKEHLLTLMLADECYISGNCSG